MGSGLPKEIHATGSSSYFPFGEGVEFEIESSLQPESISRFINKIMEPGSFLLPTLFLLTTLA